MGVLLLESSFQVKGHPMGSIGNLHQVVVPVSTDFYPPVLVPDLRAVLVDIRDVRGCGPFSLRSVIPDFQGSGCGDFHGPLKLRRGPHIRNQVVGILNDILFQGGLGQIFKNLMKKSANGDVDA